MKKSSNFYFISLNIDWYIESQAFFLRHIFAKRYSNLKSSIILFIYTIWLAKSFLYLSIHVTLPTYFLHQKVLILSCFFKLIQTPKNLVLSSGFLTLIQLGGVPISIKSSIMFCLWGFQAIASDFALFISISFNIKKLFDTWIISCSTALDSATHIVSSTYTSAKIIAFSTLKVLFSLSTSY